MKITLQWLLEHIQDIEPKTIAPTLSKLGFPIESYSDASLGSNFIIAKIESFTKHPNADKLNICQVNDGNGIRQVICGASNIYAGLMTILALPNATLPDGSKILVSKIRGIESHGMLCSAKELGIAGDASGIIDITNSHLLPGTPADQTLFPDGPQLDVELTFNRGDMMSVKGIARELSSGGIGKLIEADTISEQHTIKPLTLINNKLPHHICPAISSVLVHTNKNLEIPQYISRRLSIHNTNCHTLPVALTNYILYDLGQPMHAFDADKISGSVVARLSTEGEQIQLLSGENYTLSANIPIFADDIGPISIIGVIGGLRTSCNENTTKILFESTYINREYFREHAPHIETRSKNLFFRGLDLYGPRDAIIKILKLLNQKVSFELYENFKLQTIAPDFELIKQITGIDIKIIPQLQKLGFTQIEDHIVVPSWRNDVSNSYDLAEEVIRLYGADKIIIRPINCTPKIISPRPRNLRLALAEHGLHEVITTPLIEPSDNFPSVQLMNSAKELRGSLLPGLLKICKDQLSRKIIQWLGIFEINTCFSIDGNGITHEWQSLAILLNPYKKTHSIEKFVDLLNITPGENIPKYFRPRGSFGLSNGAYGVIHPQITGIDQTIYALEMRFYPQSQSYNASYDLSPSQTWRDLTFTYRGSIRMLQYLLGQANTNTTQITLLDTYNDHITFRIWINDNNINPEDIMQKYVSLGESAGAIYKNNV